MNNFNHMKIVNTRSKYFHLSLSSKIVYSVHFAMLSFEVLLVVRSTGVIWKTHDGNSYGGTKILNS